MIYQRIRKSWYKIKTSIKEVNKIKCILKIKDKSCKIVR